MELIRESLRQQRIWDGFWSLSGLLWSWRRKRHGQSTQLRKKSFLPRLEQLENRQMPSTLTGITEYAITTANSGPQGATYGPDGNVWFVETSASKIAKVTATGTITEYATTTGSSQPVEITSGPDGNLWFAESAGNKIAKITTAGTITEYGITTANAKPHGITTGPDGNLWFTESNTAKIGYVTTSGTFTEYSISGVTGTAQPEEIATGSDGNLWFTEPMAAPGLTHYVAKVTTGGSFTHYSLPTNMAQPTGITAGPDGNLWFVEMTAGRIGKMTTSGVLTEYSTSTGGSHDIVSGADGKVWFLQGTNDTTANIDPGSGTITTKLIPTANANPYGIANGPNGTMWITESANAANKVAKYLWDSAGNSTSAPDPSRIAPYVFGPVAVAPLDGNV